MVEPHKRYRTGRSLTSTVTLASRVSSGTKSALGEFSQSISPCQQRRDRCGDVTDSSPFHTVEMSYFWAPQYNSVFLRCEAYNRRTVHMSHVPRH